jgi:hypothetical protein
MRKIRAEYDKFEDQKRAWNLEKRKVDYERESMTSDYHRIVQERNYFSDGARKELEKQEIIKKNFEVQLDCLKREVIFLQQPQNY